VISPVRMMRSSTEGGDEQVPSMAAMTTATSARNAAPRTGQTGNYTGIGSSRRPLDPHFSYQDWK
jgi:hypothetical protein